MEEREAPDLRKGIAEKYGTRTEAGRNDTTNGGGIIPSVLASFTEEIPDEAKTVEAVGSHNSVSTALLTGDIVSTIPLLAEQAQFVDKLKIAGGHGISCQEPTSTTSDRPSQQQQPPPAGPRPDPPLLFTPARPTTLIEVVLTCPEDGLVVEGGPPASLLVKTIIINGRARGTKFADMARAFATHFSRRAAQGAAGALPHSEILSSDEEETGAAFPVLDESLLVPGTKNLAKNVAVRGLNLARGGVAAARRARSENHPTFPRSGGFKAGRRCGQAGRTYCASYNPESCGNAELVYP